MNVSSPTILLPPNQFDIGLTARPTKTGFVAVELGMGADPIAFTPEVIEAEQAGLPGWRFKKEYLRDFGAQAGQPVFESEWLDVQRRRLQDPICLMDLDEHGKLVEADDGRLRVYAKPDVPSDVLPDDVLSAVRSCGLGMDVSEGVGASDSTIQVFFADHREQAAEFADARITPPDLGRFANAVGRYYNHGLICCVRKMHGLTVLRTLIDECRYPAVWYATQPGKLTERTTDQLGWAKGEATDDLLFGRWRDAIQHDKAILRSLTCVQQHQQYIYDEYGRITHQAIASLPRAVREKHGDLVVACALAYRACIDLPKFRSVVREDPAPMGSQAWRIMYAKSQRERTRRPW